MEEIEIKVTQKHEDGDEWVYSASIKKEGVVFDDFMHHVRGLCSILYSEKLVNKYFGNEQQDK